MSKLIITTKLIKIDEREPEQAIIASLLLIIIIIINCVALDFESATP